MGIDVGNRRIGLALADGSLTIATPLETLHRRDLQTDLRVMESKLAEHNVYKVIVGLPLESSGNVGRQAKKVQRFTDALLDRHPNLDHVYWDERMSTRIAQGALLEANTRREKRKLLVDQVAAAVILQGWLDAHRGIEA